MEARRPFLDNSFARLARILPDDLSSDFTLAEKELLEKAPRGEEVDCKTGVSGNDNPEAWKRWGPERTIRAEVLRILTTHPETVGLIHHRGIRLKGVFIKGVLDLEGATVLHRLCITESALPEGIILTDARTKTLVLDGSLIKFFRGETLHVEGHLSLERSVIHEGVDLFGATVEGQLSCRGGKVQNPGGPAFSCARAIIKGDVFMDKEFQARGVNLRGTFIGGQLVCSGGSSRTTGVTPSLPIE